MRGVDIQQLRLELGMTVPQFAQLLGLNQTSIYRYEAAGDREIPIDPLPLKLITALQHQMARPDASTAPTHVQLGDSLTNALVLGGTLLALYTLLDGVYGGQQPTLPRTRMVRGAGAVNAARRRGS